MSLLHSSSIGDVTRGGQLLIHFFRMLGQVLSKFAGVLLVILLLTSVALFFNRTGSYHRYVAMQYAVAQVKYQTFRDASEPTVVRRRDGSEIQTSVGEVVNSPSIRRIWRSVLVTGIGCFMAALVLLAALFVAILWFIWRTGSVQRQDRLLRGGEILSARDAKRVLHRAGGGQRHYRGWRTAHCRHRNRPHPGRRHDRLGQDPGTARTAARGARAG